jgi:hypothetical protein
LLIDVARSIPKEVIPMKKFLYCLVIGAMLSTPAFAMAAPLKSSKSTVSADDKKKPGKGKKDNGKGKKKEGEEEKKEGE